MQRLEQTPLCDVRASHLLLPRSLTVFELLTIGLVLPPSLVILSVPPVSPSSARKYQMYTFLSAPLCELSQHWPD